jgi:hypothetical protein
MYYQDNCQGTKHFCPAVHIAAQAKIKYLDHAELDEFAPNACD